MLSPASIGISGPTRPHQATRQRRRERERDADRRDIDPGRDRRSALHVLKEGAEVDDRADEREEHDQRRDIRGGKRGTQEQGNVHQGLGSVALPAHESDQCGDTRGERDERRGRRQARDLAVDDTVGQCAYRGGGEDRAEPVEAAVRRGRGKPRNKQCGQREQHAGKRDVDQEHPAPADVADDQAAQRGPDRQRETRSHRPQPDRHRPPLRVLKRRADNRQTARDKQRRAETLQHATDQQHTDR
jgi:hypothetical protein